MRHVSWLAIAAGLSATIAHAGGIERSEPTTRALFEEGRYLEFSVRSVSPELKGKNGDASGLGGPPNAAPNGTGDLLDSYSSFSFAYKADINEQFSYAFIVDQPWGVDTKYPTVAGSIYSGVDAKLESTALTGILAYDVNERVKVYGGVRAERINAKARLPFVFGYTVDSDKQTDFGYLAGVAYQIPDIAFRVALTYYSSIKHEMNTTEFGALDTKTDIETPESINLEFQSGIAKDTLVFGSIRWVNWSEFSIEPPNYPLGTLVDYEKDWTNYTLGLGRRFTENLSGFVQASYEPATDEVLTSLGPIDGRTTLGVGATFRQDNMSLTAGVSYTWLGDTENLVDTKFDDGSAIGIGVRVGYSF